MKVFFRSYSAELRGALVFGGLLLFLAVTAPSFFQHRQLMALGTATSPVLVGAIGAALLILCRQIDISVGSQFALCSVVVGLATQRIIDPFVLTLISAGLGAVMGAFNGALVAFGKLPSIVVTLATMVTWRELLRWWREGEFVSNLPDQFQWFGFSQITGQSVVMFLGCGILLCFIFVTTRLNGGRWIYAVGSDSEAARLAGIRPDWVTFSTFVISGALVGIAAYLNAVRFVDVDPKTGTGFEMQVISAAIVGGVSISGGRGRLIGVFIGVLLLACIAPALVFLKWPPQWERVIQGIVLLTAVAGNRSRIAQTQWLSRAK